MLDFDWVVRDGYLRVAKSFTFSVIEGKMGEGGAVENQGSESVRICTNKKGSHCCEPSEADRTGPQGRPYLIVAK